MRLEQGITGEEFNKDAPDTPDIAGERPSQSEDDLRSSVMPG